MKKLFVLFMVILAFHKDVAGQKIGFSAFSYANSGMDYSFYIASSFAYGSGTNGPRVKFTYFNKSNDTVFIKALYDPTGIFWSTFFSTTFDTVRYANPYTDVNYFHVSTSIVNGYTDASGMYVKDTVWNQFDTTFYVGTSGIEEQNTVKALAIYPNPTRAFISLAIAASELLIYNTYGKVVLQTNNVAAQQPIPVVLLSGGLYYIAVYDKEQHKIGVGKFYKE
ncbi:MAG: T9SS type A sorting domain-containing protein [Chitinophagaceae bacterium]|nr:T9SS type A sorting domain-containing protein [Chitinophagaceae bacterium]